MHTAGLGLGEAGYYALRGIKSSLTALDHVS